MTSTRKKLEGFTNGTGPATLISGDLSTTYKNALLGLDFVGLWVGGKLDFECGLVHIQS